MTPSTAYGCAAATSMASAMSRHSSTSKPPRISLVSTNGPSVTTTSPRRTRTTRASRWCASGSPVIRTPRSSIVVTHLPPSAVSPGPSTGSVSRHTNIRNLMTLPLSRRPLLTVSTGGREGNRQRRKTSSSALTRSGEQQLALLLVRGHRGGRLELGPGLSEASQLEQQVPANRRQQVVPLEHRVRPEVVDDRQPSRGAGSHR